MLRNLVCSLFEHEQIRTTLPKAKDTARLAEKVITLGKRKDLSSYQNARAFLLKPELMPKLFGQFADRYKERPGGYTRIHRLGSRQGDNAPMALVELVDNAHDLRVEMTARAIGRELLTDRLRQEAPRELAGKGIDDAHDILQREVMSDSSENSQLRPKTKLNLQKVLKFNDSNFGVLSQKATAYMGQLLAKPFQQRQKQAKNNKKDAVIASTGKVPRPRISPYRERAGAASLGEMQPAMRIAKGALGSPKKIDRWLQNKSQPAIYNTESLF